MSTFEISGRKFFRIRKYMGIFLSVPILVIAFVVKGQAFENESDILRQALRRQRFAVAGCDKFLPENIKRHDIYVSPGADDRKNLTSYEMFGKIIEQSLRWIEDNGKRNRIVGIFISGSLDDGKESPKDVLNGNFMPFGAVILYK